MNESLRRALLRARLSEEDVAARLQVDPKTVRRWLEGRIPYLRHRWVLAAMLGLDEADLWPQSGSSDRTGGVQAIYPHLNHLPRFFWLELFGDAERRIDVLTDSLFLAQDPEVLTTLVARAHEGVKERLCLREPDDLDLVDEALAKKDLASPIGNYGVPRGARNVEIRLYRTTPNHFIFRSDDDCLVVQHIYGILPANSPVLHLRHADKHDIANAYFDSFNRVWGSAKHVGT